LWLGTDFAAKSALVLQLLAVGFFLNFLAWLPSTLLQGIGRPDIVAKILLAEFPLYLGMLWLLTLRLGIVGAALAWALRGGFEVTLFFLIAGKQLSLPMSAAIENGVFKGILAIAALAAAVSLVAAGTARSLAVQCALTFGLLSIFAGVAWRSVLDAADRRELRAAFSPVKTGRNAIK